MIVGGIVVAVLFPVFLVVGVSVAVAGVFGVVTLLPRVRSWIDDLAANGGTPATEVTESI